MALHAPAEHTHFLCVARCPCIRRAVCGTTHVLSVAPQLWHHPLRLHPCKVGNKGMLILTHIHHSWHCTLHLHRKCLQGQNVPRLCHRHLLATCTICCVTHCTGIQGAISGTTPVGCKCTTCDANVCIPYVPYLHLDGSVTMVAHLKLDPCSVLVPSLTLVTRWQLLSATAGFYACCCLLA